MINNKRLPILLQIFRVDLHDCVYLFRRIAIFKTETNHPRSETVHSAGAGISLRPLLIPVFNSLLERNKNPLILLTKL